MTLAMPPANSVRNARAKTIKKLSESPNKIMPRKTATTSSQDSLGSGVEDSDGAGGSLNSKKWPTFNKNKVSSPIRISSKKNMGGLVAGSPVMNSESEALDSSLKLFSNVKVTDKVLKEIENSKSPRKPLKSSPLKRNFTPDANQEIVDGLRENFHRLSVLRSTEAETLLAQYRESAERRIAAGERLIEGLRQEKMQLLERLNNRTETHVLESRSTPVKRVSSAYSDISNSSRKFFNLWVSYHF